MKPTGENNSFDLPPGLLAKLEAVADQEHRPAAEVVQTAVERYLAEQNRAAAPSETLPAKRTPAEAAARIFAHRPFRRLPEGETIRSMIEHGRA
jgi:hypothetical protein